MFSSLVMNISRLHHHVWLVVAGSCWASPTIHSIYFPFPFNYTSSSVKSARYSCVFILPMCIINNLYFIDVSLLSYVILSELFIYYLFTSRTRCPLAPAQTQHISLCFLFNNDGTESNIIDFRVLYASGNIHSHFTRLSLVLSPSVVHPILPTFLIVQHFL